MSNVHEAILMARTERHFTGVLFTRFLYYSSIRIEALSARDFDFLHFAIRYVEINRLVGTDKPCAIMAVDQSWMLTDRLDEYKTLGVTPYMHSCFVRTDIK